MCKNIQNCSDIPGNGTTHQTIQLKKPEIGHKTHGKIASLYEFVQFVRVRTLIKTDLRTVKTF